MIRNNTLVLSDGTLDEMAVRNAFRAEIASGDDDINEAVLSFIRKLSLSLINQNSTRLLPELIRLVENYTTANNIKFSISVGDVADLFDLLDTDGYKKKIKKERQDKRSAVLEAAKIVFAGKGFHEAKVDEIAELARVAKGTVYRYFESKEDILKEIIKANNKRLTEGLAEIFSKNGHMLELIKEAMTYYVDFFESNKDLYKILTHSPWILKDISDHFYKNIISHLQVVRRRIFELTRQGVVKPTDFYTVFYGIFGFIDGVIQKWFRRNCEYSLKDELPVIIEVIFYGFVTENQRNKMFE